MAVFNFSIFSQFLLKVAQIAVGKQFPNVA
jgi:hypothetical protein